MFEDLISRLENADPDNRRALHDLSTEIAISVLGWTPPSDPDGHPHPEGVPPYANSLDFAAMLVPDDMAWEVNVAPGRHYTEAAIFAKHISEDERCRRFTQYRKIAIATPVKEGTARRNTPALALCIAAIKARATVCVLTG